MALKYCPACDEEYNVDEEETTCPECGEPLEAPGDGGDGDEGGVDDEGGGGWSE